MKLETLKLALKEYGKAVAFAERAHHGQERKFGGGPYIFHPLRVAFYIKSFGGTPDMINAAILHDVMEDCEVTKMDLLKNFGGVVCSYVCELTDDKTPGNRATRKAAQREKLRNVSWEAKLIKLLDRSDNLNELDTANSFAKIYAEETLLLLEVLGDTHKEIEFNLKQKAESILKATK